MHKKIKRVSMKKTKYLFIFCILCTLLMIGQTGLAQEWTKIIDDGDDGYSETSPYDSWRTWHFPGAYNGDWRYLSGLFESPQGPVPRKGKAYWTTKVPTTGIYEISVHLFNTENRTTDADYFIEDGNGKTHHFVLNQKQLPTGWYVLGEFEWKKDQQSTIILDGTDDNQSDEADAVRWVFKKEIKTSDLPATRFLLLDK